MKLRLPRAKSGFYQCVVEGQKKKNLHLKVGVKDLSKINIICYCSAVKCYHHKCRGKFIQYIASMSKVPCRLLLWEILVWFKRRTTALGFWNPVERACRHALRRSIPQLVMRSRVYFKKSNTKNDRFGVLLHLNFQTEKEGLKNS